MATYIIFEKVGKNEKKVRLYTFRPFLATYIIFEKVGKNEQKVRPALTFRPFLATYIIFAKNKAIALTFRPQKRGKTQKVRL